MEHYADEETTLDELIEARRYQLECTRDVAYEEVVAELCESFLVDAHLNDRAAELYRTDKGIANKVLNFLKKIKQRIMAWLNGVDPESPLGKYGRELAKQYDGILDLYVQGLNAAMENYSHAENTTGEGGVMNDLRSYSEQQVKNWNSSKRIVVYESDTQFVAFISKAKADATYNQKMYFGAITHDFAADIKASTGIDVENYNLSLSASEIRKIFKSHGSEKTEALRGQRAVTEADIIKIPSVVKGATKISLCGYYNGKPMIEFVKQDNNERYTVRAVVSDKRLDLFVQTSFIGVKKGSLATPTGEQAPINTPEANSGTTSFNTSISDFSENINTSNKKRLEQSRDADYLSAVEAGDMETAQRMVDEAAEIAFANSKIRGEDGKLVKVYHGTDADFTVFDRTMGRANMDIQGLFFSPWDIEAQGYGQNVRAFYLNISNPADEGTGYKALNAHKGENYAGIKAREDLERMGYDGVNNSDEEYIAFASEQIKSADPVTYDDAGKVIPLSERFNTEQKDIRYDDSRNIDAIYDEDGWLLYDTDEIKDVFARHYTTHAEAIGEVLKNTADIEIAPNTVKNILSRVIRDYSPAELDAKARKELVARRIPLVFRRGM